MCDRRSRVSGSTVLYSSSIPSVNVGFITTHPKPPARNIPAEGPTSISMAGDHAQKKCAQDKGPGIAFLGGQRMPTPSCEPLAVDLRPASAHLKTQPSAIP